MRRLGAFVLFAACAPMVAVLVKAPGATGEERAFAPVNERETGIVSYRAAQFGEAPFLDGRAEAERTMYLACRGDYRIESEDSDSARTGPWRRVRFTCVNGPPQKGGTIASAVVDQLHEATGCPREYITSEPSDGGLRFLACQARYACDVRGREVNCRQEP